MAKSTRSPAVPPVKVSPKSTPEPIVNVAVPVPVKSYSREYKGTTYTVTETPDGSFTYNGQTFSSLTAIATKIVRDVTGKDVSLSGPAWFGQAPSGTRGPRVNRNEKNLAALKAMTDSYADNAKITDALKVAYNLIAALPPPPPPMPKTVSVTLPDGRVVEIPARFAK